MKTTYEMTIAGCRRTLPLCPLNDKLYIAAFVMFGDVELTVAAARELLAMAPPHDVLLTAESKGIPLLYEMARQSGAERYIVARKGKKLYMQNPRTVEVTSITTAKRQTLCLGEEEMVYLSGKRVLLVDDVISIGETMEVLQYLVKEAGGTVAGQMAVLAEGDAREREDILYLEKLPLFDAEGQPIA